MKTAGGIGVGALAGGLGLTTLTGGATATSNADYNGVTVTSDDGTVEYVAIYGKSRVDWEGFESDAIQFRIVNEARVVGSGAGWIELNDTGRVDLSNDDWGNYDEDTSDPGTSGYIETGIGLDSNGDYDPTIDWHIVGSDPDGYGLPVNSIDPSLLETDSDGGTKNFTVEVRSTYIWYRASGAEEFREDFTSTVGVTVNNKERSASGSSSSSGAVAE